MKTKLLSKVNAFDRSEFSYKLLQGTLNGAVPILRWLFDTVLDSSREALNLGCYTGRDLNYLLPLCKRINKPIECVDSFEPLNPEIREKLCQEIEQHWSDPLITWTWRDASEAESIRSADYVYFSTDHRFPIEHYMLTCDHPCIWASSSVDWLWPRIGQALHTKQLHLLIRAPTWISITNDESIRQQVLDNFNTINELLAPHSQYLEECGPLIKCRQDDQRSGMKYQWKYINAQKI